MMRVGLKALYLFIALNLGMITFGPTLMSQNISNTATIEFLDELDNSHVIDSNTVAVRKIPDATPSEINFYHFTSSSGTFSTPADGTKCLTGGVYVDLPDPTTSSGGTIDLSNPVDLNNASSYHIGEPVFISLKDLNRNTNNGLREFVEVDIETSNGDIEKLRLQETSLDSGMFVGVIQSVRAPPSAQVNNCELSLEVDSEIEVRYVDTFYVTDRAQSNALVDPFGTVYDSSNGKEIDGVLVRLVKNDGTLAQVFADDGVTPYPAEIITGSSFNVGSQTYQMPKGGYRFPLIPPGDYRLEISSLPPEYSFPSVVTNSRLSQLNDSAGNPYSLEGGLRGESFKVIAGPALNIDIPLDPPKKDLLIQKTVLKTQVETGDFVPYQIEVTNQNVIDSGVVEIIDVQPVGFKLVEKSVFINGKKINKENIIQNKKSFKIIIQNIEPDQKIILDYVLEVTVEAKEGLALNIAQAISSNGMSSNESYATVDVKSPFMINQTTIIGEVLEINTCNENKEESKGLEGIKLLLDDGTYAVTDQEGKFHFEGVSSGGHIVRLLDSSLPLGYRLQVCENNTCHSSTKNSQFVDLQPGSLWRLTFYAKKTKNCYVQDKETIKDIKKKKVEDIIPDSIANGMAKDWLKGQYQGRSWLFPEDKKNARLPGSIVVVKHLQQDKVTVKINSEVVPSILFNKISSNKTLGVFISQWSSIALKEGLNTFEVIIRDKDNKIVSKENRIVYYSNISYSAQFLEERSELHANGITPISLAFRITNKEGRPIRKGAKIAYRVNRPFVPLKVIQALQKDDTSMLNRQSSEMEIINDKGEAYIELAPSSKVSQVRADIHVRPHHTQEFSAWLRPDVKEWVIVGFAENTFGHRTLKRNGIFDSQKPNKIEGQARIYAKGKIKGEWIATIAYDSEKETKSKQDSFGTLIDPNQYYTLYGDSSINEKDSVSSEKLYLRIEKSKFFALFGDYKTDLTDTTLAAYDRAFTGIKSEMDGKVVGFKVFGTKQDSGYQRDEFQADGFGNIRFKRSPVIFNSEKIIIEVRDRYNSSNVLQSRVLNRYLDYSIDFYKGVINLKNIEDYQARDFNGNPRFILVEYETEENFNNDFLGGGRAEIKLLDNNLRIGATHIREENAGELNHLEGVDGKIKIFENTELKVEVAQSKKIDGSRGELKSKALRSEIIYATEKINLNIYGQVVDKDFGLDQFSSVDQGVDKYAGVFRYIFNEYWRNESKYEKSYFNDGNYREIIESAIGYRLKAFEANLGLRQLKEGGVSRSNNNSTQLIGSVKKSLFKNKFELEGVVEKNINQSIEQSKDFPDQYLLRLGYKINPQTRFILSQGYSDGADFNFFTTRLGVESSPWVGAQFKSGVNREFSKFGSRDYSNLGFVQRFSLNKFWKMDIGLDGTKYLSGDIPIKQTDKNIPLSSGGILGKNNLTEEYKSASLGTNFKNDDSSWTLRFEGKESDSEKRYSIQTGFSRELKKGIVVSSRAMYIKSFFTDDSHGYALSGDLSFGYRPKTSNWSILNRLTLRYEDLENSENEALFNNKTINPKSPYKTGAFVNNFNLNKVFDNKKHQVSLYYGSKLSFDKVNNIDYQSYTDMVGVEYRRYFKKRFDIGLQAYALNSWNSSVHKYSVGPSIGVSPIKNTWVSLGYNFSGFQDKDFSASRYTNNGIFLKLRVSFDEHTLGLRSQRHLDLLDEECKSKEKSTRKISGRKVLDFGTVFFEEDRADFTDISKVQNLDKLIRHLKDHPEIKRVEIHGHTDSKNHDQYNLDLAWRRARRVKNYLVNYGVDPSRLIVRSFGEQLPMANNENEIGRQFNRRVQFIVVEENQETKKWP